MSIRNLVITMFHWFAVRSPEISFNVHLPVLLLTLVKGRGLNPLRPKSDENLISPYNVTAESSIKIMRIEEMYREQCGEQNRDKGDETTKSDENLISPYNVTAESSIKIMRIEEMYREQCGEQSRDKEHIDLPILILLN